MFCINYRGDMHNSVFRLPQYWDEKYSAGNEIREIIII